MPDGVLLPAVGTGDTNPKVSTDQLATGAHVQHVKLMDGTADSAALVPASTANGLLVDVSRVQGTLATTPGATSPQKSYATTATVAAGASTTLDGAQIGSGKTGHLMGLLVSASVPFKAELRTVSDGIASGNVAVGFSLTGVWDWKTPGRGYVSVAQSVAAGLDGFRLVVTSLDISEPADCHISLFWDEV